MALTFHYDFGDAASRTMSGARCTAIASQDGHGPALDVGGYEGYTVVTTSPTDRECVLYEDGGGFTGALPANFTSGTVTLCAAYKFTSPRQWARILSLANTGSDWQDSGSLMFVRDNDRIPSVNKGNGGGSQSAVFPDVSFEDAWNVVTYTIGPAGATTIRVNGTVVKTGTLDMGAGVLVSRIGIGAQAQGGASGDSFRGEIGEIKLWDSVLSDPEILEQEALLASRWVVYSDDFNRADSSSLGSGWTSTAAWGISGGQAAKLLGGDDFATFNQNLGMSDAWVEADITNDANFTCLDIRCRAPGDAPGGVNAYLGFWDPSGWFALGKNFNGTWGGQFATTTGVAHPALPYKLRLQAQGSTISLWVNDVSVLSVTDTDIPTGTYVGMNAGNSGTAHVLDNYRCGPGVYPSVVEAPTLSGPRILEDTVERTTEGGVTRSLEAEVVEPSEGTATVTWTETLAAAGKKTQKATVTVSWTEAVTAAGKRVAKAVATTAHSWVVAAAGVKPVVPMKQGSATVAWTETPSAVGKRAPKGTVATQWTEVTAATGKRTPKSAVTTSWTETLAAAGKRTPKGSNTVPVTFATAAVGKRSPKATVTTTWTETTTASGTKPVKGDTTVGHTWVTTAVGVRPIVGMNQGTAAVAWTVTTVAVGYRMHEGSAATSYTESVSATGAMPVKGTAAASWTMAVVAAGKRIAKATATTAVLWTTGAIGRRAPQATATTAWTEAVAVAGKRVPKATATTNYTETLSATGKKVPKGTASTGHLWVPAATGTKPLRGSATVGYSFTPHAVGASKPSQGLGTSAVSWNMQLASSGKRTPKSAVTTSYTYALGVTSKRFPKGTVAVTYTETLAVQSKRTPKSAIVIGHTWVLNVTGERPTKGVAVITHSWPVTVESKREPVGTAALNHFWVVGASGYFEPKGYGDADWWVSPVAFGLSGVAGQVEFYMNGMFGLEMQYGDKAVIDWLLIPS